MKKLLSLLSVLTINGTAVPTTIAASPYQKEEELNSEINLQTNNLKNLKRSKRNSDELNIQLSSSLDHITENRIIQQESMWCEPATGELALRILGLNSWPQTRLHNRNYQQQISITNNMDTSLSTGTSPQNWVRAMNNVINNHNLNNRRQYSITRWNRGYFNRNEFTTLVRNSLENNVPVAIASTGRLPQYQGERNHFYLITGIREDNHPASFSRYSYQYFDPADGYFRTIREGNMYTLFGIADIDYRINIQNAENEFLRQGYSREELNRRGFIINNSNDYNNYYNYIISYNNSDNTQQETQIPRTNQAEPMDFSGQNKWYIYNFITSCLAFHSLNNYRKIRSSSNDNQYCQNSTIGGKKITIWKILDEKTKGGSLQSGDTYIGTTSGVYLLFKRGNEINLKKFDNLDFLVKDIKLDGNGSAYVEKDNNNSIVYHLNLQGWGHTEVDLNSLWQLGGNENLPFPYNK